PWPYGEMADGGYSMDHFCSLTQAAAPSTQAAPTNGSPVMNVHTVALITQSKMAKTPTRTLTTVSPHHEFRDPWADSARQQSKSGANHRNSVLRTEGPSSRATPS